LQVTDGRVEVVAVGAGNPPEVDDLFDLLATELGYEPVVDLRWVPEVRTVVTPEDRSSG